ncbi:MAG: signal recognition particle subunit SRP54 [Myxococcota bacterium]|jgi:signal recognition particle subunit SRP54
MLETLSKGFRNARLKLQGKAELSEENISSALRDVRVSLLEADVEYSVVRGFLQAVKESALGEVVTLKAPAPLPGMPAGMRVGPADHFIKICHDELVNLMGPVDTSISLTADPAVIMMVGLQGSGKTTTAGKLARKLIQDGRKPMLVAADIYRPAAIDQLMTLGRRLGVPVFSIRGMDPVQLCTLAVNQARNVGKDVVIFDTAGRLAVDNKLMGELEQIKKNTNPENIFFVADAMIGQDAVKTAAEFDRRLGFTGFILTKLDGDARGGAALSIKSVTGKPIKFLGMGEALDDLEEFRPEGLADRILGFGDVVGLMQDFEKVIDQETAEKDAAKMLSGQFTFEDFLKQISMIKKMGSLRSIFEKLPGMGEMLGNIPAEALDDRELMKVEAMIHSMTRQERRDPDVLNESRFVRIAGGSGRPVQEVRDLYDRFKQVRAMMGQLGQSGLFGGLGGGGGGGLMGGMNPFGGGGGSRSQRRAGGGGNPLGGMFGAPTIDTTSSSPELSSEDKLKLVKQRRDARKNRKKNRKKK